MITLTAPDDSQVQIDGSRVVRVRRAFAGESQGDIARTHIDWVGLVLVKEEPAVVAPRVEAELPSLSRLALPDGSPIWCDAKKADGPVRTTPSERQGGVRSALILAGKKQYLSNTPQEVSTAIAAKGGKPLPIPDEGFFGTVLESVRSWISPVEKWD